ncbi:MAG TPA: STAS domain-containing protein [Acidimicrobiia bacterium]|nr:STAS domain-containing protein [Acidimicrobiia bacterium]
MFTTEDAAVAMAAVGGDITGEANWADTLDTGGSPLSSGVIEEGTWRQLLQHGQFDMRLYSVDGITTVTVAGELDIGTVPACLGRIDGYHLDGETKVVLDLQALTFIDVAGLRALATVRDRLSHQGLEVQFANPPRAVTRIIDILGLDLDELDLQQPPRSKAMPGGGQGE